MKTSTLESNATTFEKFMLLNVLGGAFTNFCTEHLDIDAREITIYGARRSGKTTNGLLILLYKALYKEQFNSLIITLTSHKLDYTKREFLAVFDRLVAKPSVKIRSASNNGFTLSNGNIISFDFENRLSKHMYAMSRYQLVFVDDALNAQETRYDVQQTIITRDRPFSLEVVCRK